LIGYGKLIVGYPKDAWVKLPEYAIQAHYKSYTSMRVDQQKTQRGLFEMRTLSKPDAEFDSFLEARAPFIGITWPIQIHSLAMGADGPVVGYRLFGIEQQEQRRKLAITARGGWVASRLVCKLFEGLFAPVTIKMMEYGKNDSL
jgi:hypothetical protein